MVEQRQVEAAPRNARDATQSEDERYVAEQVQAVLLVHVPAKASGDIMGKEGGRVKRLLLCLPVERAGRSDRVRVRLSAPVERLLL